jgi:hypothetical protein
VFGMVWMWEADAKSLAELNLGGLRGSYCECLVEYLSLTALDLRHDIQAHYDIAIP